MVTRGDIVLVSLPGDYAQLRPALVIQSRLTLAIMGACCNVLFHAMIETVGIVE